MKLELDYTLEQWNVLLLGLGELPLKISGQVWADLREKVQAAQEQQK